MSDTMTVKELAEVAGVNPRTIYRAVKVLNYDMKSGVAAQFDHEQCLRIVGAIKRQPKRVHLSQPPMTNVQGRQIAEVGQNDRLINLLSDMVPAMIEMAKSCNESNAMTRRLVESMSARQVIAPPEQEYSTVSGYCRRNGIHVDLETAKRLGKIATAISNERGYPIRKISDERWGEVNAYHVSVLAQAVAA